jgi:hypothetical protein
VAAAGDIACAPEDPYFNSGLGQPGFCQMAATADLLDGVPALTAVLPLGDLQYETGEPLSRWEASYEPTWGRFKWLSRPVAGNHEYGSGDATTYFQYFGEAAGPPGLGYYSFDVGSWHMVALNSECHVVSCDDDSAQIEWLRADLQGREEQCVLAYWHRPLFSTGIRGGHPTTQGFWRVLSEAEADVVLNGHNHGYERFAPMDPSGTAATDGILAFVVGTGGKSLYPFPGTLATSVARSSSFGVLFLTLHPDRFDWRFVPATGASFTDAGSAEC